MKIWNKIPRKIFKVIDSLDWKRVAWLIRQIVIRIYFDSCVSVRFSWPTEFCCLWRSSKKKNVDTWPEHFKVLTLKSRGKEEEVLRTMSISNDFTATTVVVINTLNIVSCLELYLTLCFTIIHVFTNIKCVQETFVTSSIYTSWLIKEKYLITMLSWLIASCDKLDFRTFAIERIKSNTKKYLVQIFADLYASFLKDT